LASVNGAAACEQLPASNTGEEEDSFGSDGKQHPLPGIAPLGKLLRCNQQAEKEAILAALQSARWNRKKAAAMLGVDYKALLYKMKKLGIGEN
jgi:DNA-binding NtrC family response regulator